MAQTENNEAQPLQFRWLDQTASRRGAAHPLEAVEFHVR